MEKRVFIKKCENDCKNRVKLMGSTKTPQRDISIAVLFHRSVGCGEPYEIHFFKNTFPSHVFVCVFFKNELKRVQDRQLGLRIGQNGAFHLN